MANLNTPVIYHKILTLDKVELKLPRYFYNIFPRACTKLFTTVVTALS